MKFSIAFLILSVVGLGLVDESHAYRSRGLSTKSPKGDIKSKEGKYKKSPKDDIKKKTKKGSKKEGKRGKKGTTVKDNKSDLPMDVYLQTFTDLYATLGETDCGALHVSGVLYQFYLSDGSISSNFGDCTVVSFGPPPQDSVDPPGLEGTADGMLSLTFDTPTSVFSFGIAKLAPPTATGETVSVKTFTNAGATVSVFTLGNDGGPFVGGKYSYAGAEPIAKVEISFPGGAAPRVFLDNFEYEVALGALEGGEDVPLGSAVAGGQEVSLGSNWTL